MMTPGGSFANIMSIILARHQAFPQVKEEGVQNLPKLTIIGSDVAHYSLKKGLIMCGFGTNALL